MRTKPTFRHNTIIEGHVSQHDNETPVCALCEDTVGEHNDAFLMLRGQFFYRKDEGYAMFVLDPDTKIQFVELENGLGPGKPQLAVIVDSPDPAPIIAAHSECVHENVLDNEDDDDDDEPDDHLDELDREMRDAMDRDVDPDDDNIEFDDNDMLVRT